MRLTDDIMRLSDSCAAETTGRALMLAAAGRFGLIPSTRPFALTLNIDQDVACVESLCCLAVTRGGQLIDIDFDTRYTNCYDTRLVIPEGTWEEGLILTVCATADQWQPDADGNLAQPVYTFTFIAPGTPVPDNAMPIAHIVNEYGWRIDETDFVPPCLFLKSHPDYEELLRRFETLLADIDTKARKVITASGPTAAISIFWPIAQQLLIAANKECDLMTPMTLLSNVQKLVSAFNCACTLDPALQLSDDKAKKYSAYPMAPYNYKDAYQRIKIGLALCFEISEGVEKLTHGTKPQQEQPQPAPAQPTGLAAPTIAADQMQQVCITPEATIPIYYPLSEAKIHFTTDGSTPNQRSKRAAKGQKGFVLKFDNGFRQANGSEPDKVITLKIIAMANGQTSSISTYQVKLSKSMKFRDGVIPI